MTSRIDTPVTDNNAPLAQLTTQPLLFTGDHTSTNPLNLRHWAVRLMVSDSLVAGVGAVSLLVARFGAGVTTLNSNFYAALAVTLVPAWLVTLALSGSYDPRFLAVGAEQYRRVVNGAAWLLAVLTLSAFASHSDVSRGVILGSVPFIGFLSIIERFVWRRALQRRLTAGYSTHRVMAIGSPGEVRDLVVHMHRATHAGFRVVAALTPGMSAPPVLPRGVAWAGGELENIAGTVVNCGADTVALSSAQVLPRGGLRRLSWQLEDTDIDLMVAPAMTDIAGPRIRIRPVEGLPLLHIDRPQFSGVQRVVKSALDRGIAAALVVVLSPVLLACAVGVRVTSRGPIVYRQVRMGLRSKPFTMFKFRSMAVGAHALRADAAPAVGFDGALFKIRQDPRVTPFGRFLRRWSLDELPQLLNVLAGSMSLVGPRPLPIEDTSKYEGDAVRRVLVKPGLTGLWQVNGRSDLSWEESIRLDLHYVDHWSVGLDLVLLWRTVVTVVRGRGAY